MAVDVPARGLALAASRTAGSANAAVTVLPFDTLASRTIPAAATVSAAVFGGQAATIVCDARATAALAAAHPRFCRRDAGGRYFRLLAPFISVDQGGATGRPGTNDQPAIQATINYAIAVGIPEVRFIQPKYELWCPIRTTPSTVVARDGHPITITGSIRLYSPTFTTLNLKGHRGGNPDTEFQMVALSAGNSTTHQWRGRGIHLFGDQYPYPVDPADWRIQSFQMENIRLNGNRTADRNSWQTNPSFDTSNKGIFSHNPVRRIALKNVEVDHFFHELLYGGGVGSAQEVEIYHENVKAHWSRNSAFNWQWTRKFTDINGEYGNTYIAAEVFGGEQRWIGTRFYDSDVMNFAGVVYSKVPESIQATPTGFSFPAYDNYIPRTTLVGVTCDGGPNGTMQVGLGSHVEGDLTLIDAGAYIDNYAGEINVRITAI